MASKTPPPGGGSGGVHVYHHHHIYPSSQGGMTSLPKTPDTSPVFNVNASLGNVSLGNTDFPVDSTSGFGNGSPLGDFRLPPIHHPTGNTNLFSQTCPSGGFGNKKTDSSPAAYSSSSPRNYRHDSPVNSELSSRAGSRAVSPIIGERVEDGIITDNILNGKLEKEELERAKLVEENIELKSRLRNILQHMSATSQTPSMQHARKLLPILSKMDLPKVDYKELLDTQVKSNYSLAQFLKNKLEMYYLPQLDAIGQKKLNEILKPIYKVDKQEFLYQKEILNMNKKISILTRKTDQAQSQIRSTMGENAQLLTGKQCLETELIEQKESASESKQETERLKEQFLLVNATVAKFLKTLNFIKKGTSIVTIEGVSQQQKMERTIQGMKSTLCKLAKESNKLQAQLDATLKDQKLYEVKYKALHLECQKTWKSGVNHQESESGSHSAQLYRALESAEEQAKTGLPLASHHDPVWNLTSEEIALASERPNEDNKKAIHFLTKLIHNPGQEPVEIFNELFLNERAEERYKALKFLAREFCIHHRKGSCMTQLMKDLQQMNKFREMEIALRSISLVISRVLECDFARCWYVNQGKKTAWVVMASKKSESRTITKDLNDGSYVSQAYHSQSSVNITDAYADPDFCRDLDAVTGYRTKAVLCAPIRTQGKVRAVIEAINKISTASSVFDQFDEFLLHVIGYATVDVVNKCQKHRANVQASQRKDILLEAAEDLFQKCHGVKDLFRVLHDRMHQMFRATDVRIVLVHLNHLQRIDVDLDGCLLTREFGMVGLVGECVREKHYFSIEKPRRTCGRRFHHGVDLDSDGKVFFWPMLYQERVSVVMQFAVPDTGSTQQQQPTSLGELEDDGVFDSSNLIHVHALEKLFAMGMFFFEKWFPSAIRLFPFKKKIVSKFESYIQFKKLMQPQQWKSEMESYATLIIQRFFRRNKLRYEIFGLARKRIQSARFIQANWCIRYAKKNMLTLYRRGFRELKGYDMKKM